MKIKIMENGPILIDVSAAVVKKGNTEETFSGKTLALCRCGHSDNFLRNRWKLRSSSYWTSNALE